MDITRIIAIGIIGTVLAVIIKEYKPSIAIGVSIATAILIILAMLSDLRIIINTLTELSEKINMDYSHIKTLLRIIGIAYIAEFGASACRDAGEGAIASKIEIASKILIVAISLPILISLMNILIGIL